MNRNHRRGDVYYADLGKGVGSEQFGTRPVVIIQNDVGNRYSPTLIVAAVSSQVETKAILPTHHIVTEGCFKQPSVIMLEQLRTIDKSRIGKYIGTLSQNEITAMNRALKVSVGLHNYEG